MECDGQAPGFFGKLPSHGDFVGRRLPPEVRQRLDEWLQRALMHSKAELGPAWLATWGSSPLWRFVIGAGVCGEQAWAGVMMPSADRVGRCFPLLLGAGIDGTPSLRDCLTRHEHWFAELEALALSALDRPFSLEAFDAALVALHGSPAACMPPGLERDVEAMSFKASVVALPVAGLPVLVCSSLSGKSAWWTDGSASVARSLAVCRGLPEPFAFPALVDGHWGPRGWALHAGPGNIERRPADAN